MKKVLIVSGTKEIKKFSIGEAVQAVDLISSKIGAESVNVQDISTEDIVTLVSANVGPFDEDIVAIAFVDLDMNQVVSTMTALTKAFRLRTSRKIDTFHVSTSISGDGVINKLA